MIDSFWSPVFISIKVSLLATCFGVFAGMVFGWLMARYRFWGKGFLESCLMLPLVLPPTAIGLFLLALLGNQSELGEWLVQTFQITFIFSYWGAVLAAAIVAFPLTYQTLKSGFESVDLDVANAARCDGANAWQVFRYIYLPLTRKFFATAVILGFTRSLGEFGATLIVAGNIPGETQTVPTAMYIAIESGQDRLALSWALCSAVLSFVMLSLVNRQREKRE
ncbi:molybdate ABC transporter permease subunit [Paenactinomyces guangxiensis]|uniref:Molybdenum transport system permease n=1 Tax=Paenactinomyces guangxiensis TaxID=1490290 RepID=A0A7W1WQ16_9BACL|nr:molybdate ABC transporter permease subunit [Paenactinomyces guangxiensis]MBA4493959.1 molybdate ABC transporter permease subunit [Paenactinomyces guangxiensis]MBH8591426.1 molybdate ABC transporter permease subunit [Paenactinomyces guangxiensis]